MGMPSHWGIIRSQVELTLLEETTLAPIVMTPEGFDAMVFNTFNSSDDDKREESILLCNFP